MGRVALNKQSVLLFLFILFFSGCADVSSITRNESRSFSLDSKARTYVTIPSDGQYGQQTYTGSGRITAGIVHGAFSTRMTQVDIADKYESYENAINTAISRGYQYLVFPKITHWEDRNTAWSGRPSKASINIRIIDVTTGDILDSVLINSRSSVMRLTDPSPEDALPEPVQQYVNSLMFS